MEEKAEGEGAVLSEEGRGEELGEKRRIRNKK
jgi:hypothetical protein